MKEINYPPERTIVLGEAADHLEEAEDPADAGLPEDPRSDLDTLASGARWLVDEFGEEAEITIKGIDSGTRARIEDHITTGVVGDVGGGLLNNYVLAASIVGAPWLEDGDDLDDKVEAVGHLPNQVTDWLASELDDLTRLDAGN